MIDMIRAGRTRNLLRASSSLSEIWLRSAHLHLGRRHLTGPAKRPDKSSHSITTPKAQKFLANEGGIHKRRFDPGRVPSAICPRESVLPVRLRPDFLVVFEGYAGGAEHWPRPLVHDHVVAWEAVKPDVVQRMLLSGVAVDSPTDAALLHSDIFGNPNQARLCFARAGFSGQTPIRDPYREMTLKSAAYRRGGRGRSWQRAYWLTGSSDFIRKHLVEVLGDLVEWKPDS